MDLINILNTRYSTKSFDGDKKISDAHFEQIKALLQMSPNSTNLQPWHFVIANTDAGKQRIAKGTDGLYQFNTPKVLNASHVILFCARTADSVDETYLTHVTEQEDKDGRFANADAKAGVHGVRKMFLDMHKYDFKDTQHWLEKQVYLNMGGVLLGAASLGIDALPMEGVDLQKLDEEFDLRAKGFTSLAVIALGYRAADDFNASLPKSRLPQDEILTLLD